MRERQTGDVVRLYGKAIAAQLGELLAHRIDDSLMSEPRRRHLRHRAAHHRVYGRQAAPILCLHIRHSVLPSFASASAVSISDISAPPPEV